MNQVSDFPTKGSPVNSEFGRDELENYIRKRIGLSVRHFHLKPAGEGLILCGRTQSYYVKQLVQEAVMQRTTIPIISNEIQVNLLPSA